VRLGPSAVLARTIRTSSGASRGLSAFSDCPLGTRGPSAFPLRTVRPEPRRQSMSFASCVVLPIWIELGLVPRVGTSVVTM
jgi:hypothetical protein